MTPASILIIIVFIVICIELAARVFYYIRKNEFSLSERIKLIFLGRWLINEASSSPLYIDEIASSLGVTKEFMISILSEASGKDIAEIKKIFLDKTGQREKHVFYPLLGFLPAPNQDIAYLKTNLAGFRDRNNTIKKPPHTRRVLLLGGSVAFGRTATSEDTTIATQLERKLNDNRPGRDKTRWEVINLAVPDFISIQELILLIKSGMQYDPDVVISFSGINDLHHYLGTGQISEPTSMCSVKTAYDAFFGDPVKRSLIILGSYLVSVYYLNILIRSKNRIEEGELSPYIYTIW
jgi:hypothetical protein